MSNVLEKEVEAKLRKMIERHGGLCLKWVCPGWAGVPDRIVLLPGGRVMFVELKRPKGGKVSSLQTWWQKRLTKFGFYACFVFTVQDIEDLERKIKGERPRFTCGECDWFQTPACRFENVAEHTKACARFEPAGE